MREIMAIAVFVMTVSVLSAQEVEIQSFGNNGQLAWSAPSGSVCTIEWVHSLETPAEWRRGWAELKNITLTNSNAMAYVPMFYRVTAYTNGLFFPLPLGRTFEYLATNAAAEVWTQRWAVTGMATTRFTSNNYVVVESYPRDGSTMSWRSTDREAYVLDWTGEDTLGDVLSFRKGETGTTWTNVTGGYDDDGTWDFGKTVYTIVTNEQVTVPAGAFDAVRIDISDTNTPPELSSSSWIAPGLGLVKHIQYDLWPPENIPEVWMLNDIHDQ